MSGLYGIGYGSPTMIRDSGRFYKTALEMAKGQLKRTGGQNRQVYFKIVPESRLNGLAYEADGFECSVSLKVFSSPRESFLNKIPNRMYRIKDIRQVIVTESTVCEMQMPVSEAPYYADPFEFLKRFSVGCVLDKADEIRRMMGSYDVRIMHPFEMASRPVR